jgi:hypothetical protein
VREQQTTGDDLNSENGSDIVTSEPITELQELFAAVADSITGLFQLSMVLRKATPHDRYAKLALVDTYDCHSDIDYVWHKYPYARNTNESAGEWLVERLGRANAHRREYFKYSESHHQKSASVPVMQPQEAKQSNQVHDPGPIPAGTELDDAGGRRILSDKSYSMLAPTTATTYVENAEISKLETQSLTSYATSIGTEEDGNLSIPPPPKESENEKEFECRYCYTIQVVKTEHAWRYSLVSSAEANFDRRHVLQDLRPYVCTFKDCSLRLYSSRREWFEHEIVNHRRSWHCDKCSKSFPVSRAFREHASVCQTLITENQLDALTIKAEQSVKKLSPADCPLCDEWNKSLVALNPGMENLVVTLDQFEKHLGKHQEKISLFALPRTLDENEESEGKSNVAAADVDNSMVSQNRDEGIPSHISIDSENMVERGKNLSHACLM